MGHTSVEIFSSQLLCLKLAKNSSKIWSHKIKPHDGRTIQNKVLQQFCWQLHSSQQETAEQ